jgi:PAS domain S-box-containing protein
MTLRTKMLVAQAPLIAGLVLLAALGSLTTQKLGRSAEAILEDNYLSLITAQRMQDALARDDRAAFAEALRAQEANVTEAGEGEVTARLRAAWTRYRDGDAPHAAVVFTTIEEIIALNQDAMVRKSEAAKRSAQSWNTLLLLLAAAASGLAIAASFALTARLLRPVAILGHAARRVAGGDLGARVRIEGRDEIAELAREFNAMAEHLERYRKSSLGELLEAQQAAQAAIDSLPDPVLVLGLDGGLLHTNQASETLLGLDLAKGGGAAIHHLPPDAREVIERVRQHVLGGRGAYSPKGLEEAFRFASGDGDRHFLPRATPLYDEAGAVHGATVVLQDVTRLLRFDQLKDDLVATVAHELRTPLTSLRMAIHLCAEEIVGPLTAKQADLLHAAREDCERLQGIVDELLDLSRIQGGRVELRVATLELEGAVAAALDAARAAAEARGVTLRSEVLPGSGAAAADPERLSLVFANLLANAVRHSPPGEEVVVRARAEGAGVRFEVSDRGPGVPPEYQHAIFEKFFRVPGTTSEGAGLGLFIAKELIAAHGGEIGVTSDGRSGSTFWFTVPAAA